MYKVQSSNLFLIIRNTAIQSMQRVLRFLAVQQAVNTEYPIGGCILEPSSGL